MHRKLCFQSYQSIVNMCSHEKSTGEFVQFLIHWAHKTSLTPPLVIEVPVPSQESGWFVIEVPVPSQKSGWSCIYVLCVSIVGGRVFTCQVYRLWVVVHLRVRCIDCGWSCIYVLGVSIVGGRVFTCQVYRFCILSTIFLLDFEMRYCFSFYSNHSKSI